MRMQIKGTRSVADALAALRQEFSSAAARRSVLPALRKAIEPAYRAIRPAVPRDTGKLQVKTKRSAKISTQRDRRRKYHSKNSLAYSYVSVGVGYVDEKGEYRPAAESLEFGSAERPAQPFLRANFERSIPAMTQDLAEGLQQSINTWATKQRAKR
jgi:HK97 gp10 family phage protein